MRGKGRSSTRLFAVSIAVAVVLILVLSSFVAVSETASLSQSGRAAPALHTATSAPAPFKPSPVSSSADLVKQVTAADAQVFTPSVIESMRSWTQTASPSAWSTYVSTAPGPERAILSTESADAQRQTVAGWLTGDGFNIGSIIWGALTSSPIIGGLIAAASGCAVGAVVGSVGAGVGAAPGCLVGAIVALGAFLYGLYIGSNLGSTGCSEDTFDSVFVTVAHNMEILTEENLQIFLSAINDTVYAMENEADALALAQLSNSSFNVAQDMQQSFVAYQLGTIEVFFEGQLAQEVNLENAWYNSLYGNGSCFSGSSRILEPFGTSPSLGIWSNMTVVTRLASSTAGPNTSAAHQYFYAQGNNLVVSNQKVTETAATDFLNVGVGATCTIAPIIPSASFPTTKTFVANTFINWSFNSGIYVLNTTGASTECQLFGLGILPLNVIGSWVNDGAFLQGPWVAACDKYVVGSGVQVPGCNPLLGPLTATGTTGFNLIFDINAPVTICFTGTSCSSPVGPAYLMPTNNVWNQFPQILNTMAYFVATTANTYWLFLRVQGYTTLASIPFGCLILYPDVAFPATLISEIDGFTALQLLNIYLAYMNGLAIFYDTPPNTSGFCNGHPVFNLGGAGLANLYINITGFIYAPSGSNHVFPGEQLGTTVGNVSLPAGTYRQTLATWAVNGSLSAPIVGSSGTQVPNASQDCWAPEPPVTAPPSLVPNCSPDSATNASVNATQLILWPLVRPFFIPVGVVFAVPALNPMIGIATQPGLYFQLIGNGTSKGAFQSGPGPGDSIYILTCKVNGTEVANGLCPMQYSSINGSLQNITVCTTACTPPVPNSSACSVPFLGAIAGFLSFFGSEVACFLAYLVLFIIIAFFVYVIVVIYRSARGKG